MALWRVRAALSTSAAARERKPDGGGETSRSKMMVPSRSPAAPSRYTEIRVVARRGLEVNWLGSELVDYLFLCLALIPFNRKIKPREKTRERIEKAAIKKIILIVSIDTLL